MSDDLPEDVLEARRRLEPLTAALAKRIGPDHAGNLLLAHAVSVLTTAMPPADLVALLRDLAGRLDAGEGRETIN